MIISRAPTVNLQDRRFGLGELSLKLAAGSRLSRDSNGIGAKSFASLGRLQCRTPGPVDEEGLALARPRRHRRADHVEPLLAVARRMKICAGRYRHRDAGGELDDLFVVAELTPHPSAARGDIPDFLDRAMGD